MGCVEGVLRGGFRRRPFPNPHILPRVETEGEKAVEGGSNGDL